MLLNYIHVRTNELFDVDEQYVITLFLSSFAVKQPYKTPDEIVKDPSADTNHGSAAIIKSASTPASLQTIVRFSNGSNMSLQHKVTRALKFAYFSGELQISFIQLDSEGS